MHAVEKRLVRNWRPWEDLAALFGFCKRQIDDVLGSEKEHFTNGLKAVPSPIWSYHAGRQCPKIRDLRFGFGLPRRPEKIKKSHHDHIRAGRLNASSDFLRVHRAPDGQGEKRSDLENIQHFFKKCHLFSFIVWLTCYYITVKIILMGWETE